MMMNAKVISDQQYRRIEQVQRALLRRAGAARTNPREFFSFVIREEVTQKRVQCRPFQILLFKFVEHFDRCVVRMPVGSSKTFTMAGLSMFLLGKNVTTRGAIISASQEQAKKPVGMVRDYIATSHELKLVFPHLRRSTRLSDPWTQSKITIERPPGIRDPSLSAVGYKGKLPGSRLNWILVDDILTEENTSTEEQRKAVSTWFASTVLSRRDIRGTKIVVTNTPWNPTDLTYQLEKAGWPTLTIDINGNIFFSNTCEDDLLPGVPLPREGEFDCDDIRPSKVGIENKAHRLTAHDSPEFNPDLEHLDVADRFAHGDGTYFDEYDVVPLWPEKFGREEIEQLKVEYRANMHQYYRIYECKCRDDESAKVKVEWIEKCKEKARDLGIFTFTSKWTKGNSFTGVDLGIGKKATNDRTSVFTFAVLPDNHRQILRIDSGHWSGSEVINLLQLHHDSYGSIIRVETNAAQDLIRQWALERNISLPVRGMPTGKNKRSKTHGVESLFVEIENAAWLIPNDPMGGVVESVQRFIDTLLYYNPMKHTGDELMSAWIGLEQARSSGALSVYRKKNDEMRKRLGAALSMR